MWQCIIHVPASVGTTPMSTSSCGWISSVSRKNGSSTERGSGDLTVVGPELELLAVDERQLGRRGGDLERPHHARWRRDLRIRSGELGECTILRKRRRARI